MRSRTITTAKTMLAAIAAIGFLDIGCATTRESSSQGAREAPQEPWREARPAAGEPAPLTFPTIQKAELKNGLTVLLVEEHALPTVHASLVVRAGASHDGKDAGLADITWDLLDEGAGTMGAAALANAFADIGASIDTGAGRESGAITVRVLRTELENALELMAVVAQKPTFSTTDFDRIKRLHQGALKKKQGDPNTLASQLLMAEVYGADHAYGHPADGTVASIEKIKQATVKRFWSEHAGPKNAALVLVGDLTIDDAKALAEKQLGKWRGGPAKAAKVPSTPAARKATKIVVIDFPGAPQTKIRIARPLLAAGDPEQAQAIVMNEILGGMFTSRLNLKLREEKQWSYGVNSSVETRLGVAPFVIRTDVQTDKTADALVEIFAQLETLKTGGVTEAELALAKAHYTRSLPALFALPRLQAAVAAQLFTLGLPADHYAALSAAVTASTGELVKSAADRAIVKDDFVVVLVGDRAKIEASLTDKALGEVVFVGRDGVVVSGAK